MAVAGCRRSRRVPSFGDADRACVLEHGGTRAIPRHQCIFRAPRADRRLCHRLEGFRHEGARGFESWWQIWWQIRGGEGIAGNISSFHISNLLILLTPRPSSNPSLSANLNIAHQRRYLHLAASTSAGSFADNSADTLSRHCGGTGFLSQGIGHIPATVAAQDYTRRPRAKSSRAAPSAPEESEVEVRSRQELPLPEQHL